RRGGGGLRPTLAGREPDELLRGRAAGAGRLDLGSAGAALATLRLAGPLGVLLGLALVFLAAAVAAVHSRSFLSHSAPFLLTLLYMTGPDRFSRNAALTPHGPRPPPEYCTGGRALGLVDLSRMVPLPAHCYPEGPRATTRAAVLVFRLPVQLGDPGAHPRRSLQPGAPRGARGGHRRASGPAPGKDRAPSLAPRPRQRTRAAAVLPGDRRGDPRRGGDDSGRRMVRRQLPRGGRGGAAGPGGSAAGVLPPAPQARGGSARRLSPRARPGVGLRGAHRQPRRARDPPAVRPRFPAGPTADHRRAVGGPDRAARRARGEPAAAGRAHRGRPRRPPVRRHPRQRAHRPGRPTPPAAPGSGGPARRRLPPPR